MHSYSGGVTLSLIDGSAGRLSLSPNVVYRGKVFFEDLNSPDISQEGFALVNLRATYALPDRRTEIVLVGRNLSNKEYIIDAGNTGGAFGIPTFIAGAPRFVTLQVSYGLR
jgi:outer membrane receptor protein involved in Fe transport